MQAPITDLLVEAATLMVAGMLFVFVFLTILIAAVKVIGFINTKLPVQQVDLPVAGKKSVSKTTSQDDAVTAAISAAVHRYRQEHQA